MGDAAATVLETAPGLLFAALILVAGWLAARLARAGVHKLANSSNRLLQNLSRRESATPPVSSGIEKLCGNLAFAIVLFLSFTVALQVAGFSALFDWFRGAAALLPNVVVGAVIIVGAYLLGVVAREQIATRMPDADARRRAPLPRAVQFSVVAIGVIVGLDQMGVDVGLLVVVVGVLAAAVAVAFAVAFALGATVYVRNLIGARVAGRELSPGLRVRIDGIEGTVLEVTATQIALDTDDGRVLLPAQMALEHVVVISTGAARADDDA